MSDSFPQPRQGCNQSPNWPKAALILILSRNNSCSYRFGNNSTQREGQRGHSSKASHSHGCFDLLPKCHSTNRVWRELLKAWLRSGAGRSVPALCRCFWGVLQKLKELFAFCLTCVLLSTGFAGPGVVCQASCEFLGFAVSLHCHQSSPLD